MLSTCVTYIFHIWISSSVAMGMSNKALSSLLLLSITAFLGVYGELNIYYNGLRNGFIDWSWSTDYVLAATDNYRSAPCSVRFTPRDWSGVFFHFKGADTTQYSGIQFFVHPGTLAKQTILFALSINGEPVLKYQLPPFIPEEWNEVNIKFSEIDFEGWFDGVWFQDGSDGDGSRQNRLWIDDITLIGTCDNVKCPKNSACRLGECVCTQGFGGKECSEAPSIQSLTITNAANKKALTALSGAQEEEVMIAWKSTGNMTALSLALVDVANDLGPSTYLDAWVTNNDAKGGAYLWQTSSQYDAGKYKIRVFYSNKVYAESGVITKSSKAFNPCGRDCSFRGTCGKDTDYRCRCAFGYTGKNCENEPEEVNTFVGYVRVQMPYTAHEDFPRRLPMVVTKDLARALQIVPQQVAIKRVRPFSNAASSEVVFEITSAGAFGASVLTVPDAQKIVDIMLADDDSTLSRSLYKYDLVVMGKSLAFRTASQSLAAWMLLCVLVVYFMMH